VIFRSEKPPLSFPEVAFTPLMLERAARWADRTALVDGVTGRGLTFGEWVRGVRRGAAGLAARGFGKGDVFAIFSTNQPEYAIAFHAVSLAGGATTTINPTYTVEELGAQLRDARARYLVTIPPFLDKALTAARAAGVQETFVFGEGQGATPFADLLAAEGDPPAVDVRPREDVVALPYSSGTTGLPKGVMLTHHNLVANLLQMEACLSLGERDTLVAVLPFFHIYGLMVIMNLGLFAGSPVVTLPRFDLEGFLQALAKYRVTFAQVVPPIALALAKHPSVAAHDLSSLRAVFSGAAPLGEAVTRACGERLGCMVMQGYGLTETSPGAIVSPNDPARLKPGSVGQLIPNTECQVVDVERGVPVGPGERGEVWIRGPQVMKGYLGRPDATAAMIDADGWLHTGDIGYADADGHFFIVDRVKELIKYKGLQIAPAELEAQLLAHPGVADAAVIGVPDEDAGEVPKAFLVLKGAVEPQEILDFVAARVAPYKKVRHVQVVDAIPKSPSGKILRRVLVERERAAKPPDA
jgi:acyl-CoA synthetase (AMP-forming)/AMP-acid ligase II